MWYVQCTCRYIAMRRYMYGNVRRYIMDMNVRIQCRYMSQIDQTYENWTPENIERLNWIENDWPSDILRFHCTSVLDWLTIYEQRILHSYTFPDLSPALATSSLSPLQCLPCRCSMCSTGTTNFGWVTPLHCLYMYSCTRSIILFISTRLCYAIVSAIHLCDRFSVLILAFYMNWKPFIKSN